MRRLLWHLNEESGGIGWGSPEAMGEIMARHQQLSEEYASILISYITPSGNYLEYEPLQQGVLWGIGRLGYSHPDRVSAAAPCLLPFLSSQNVNLRGLAAWASGPMMDPQLWTVMEQLRNDRESFTFYWDDRFLTREVSEVAEAALNWVLTKKNRISQ
jgi:hypothetical protein